MRLADVVAHQETLERLLLERDAISNLPKGELVLRVYLDEERDPARYEVLTGLDKKILVKAMEKQIKRTRKWFTDNNVDIED